MISYKKKHEGVQALRALAAIMVVIQHSVWHSTEHLNYSLHNLKISHIGGIGVGVFFVISGFVITLSRSQNKMFLINRMIRIYPPFWLLVFFVLIKRSSYFTIDSFLLLPGSDFNSSYAIPYWTLVYEMFFYFVVYILILLKLSKKYYINFMLSWMLVIVVYNIYFEVNYPVPHYSIFFSPMNIFFVLGVCIALNQKTLSKIHGYQLVIVIICTYQLLQHTNAMLFFINEALMCSAMLLLFLKISKPSKYYSFLGDSSYGLYLIHNIIILVIIRLVKHYEISMNLLQLVSLTFVLSMAIGLVYGYVESIAYKKISTKVKSFF